MKNRKSWKKLNIPYSNSAEVRKPTCICGKVMFDKKGAQTKRNFMVEKEGVEELYIYQCNYSPYAWHLTSKKPRNKINKYNG